MADDDDDDGINIALSLDGSPDAFIPREVNTFQISDSSSGPLLQMIYNPPVDADELEDGDEIPAFLVGTYTIDPEDLRGLAEVIYEHLGQTGYIEGYRGNPHILPAPGAGDGPIGDRKGGDREDDGNGKGRQGR